MSRADESNVEELLPGPGGVSETREEDVDGEPMDGDEVAPDTARSRAPSTVTCVSDRPGDIDMPLPAATGAVVTAS